MADRATKDRDDAAHRAREQSNLAAEASLEDWVRSIVPPAPGQHVCDLGCGTGKLVFAYASGVLPGGSVLGIDIAPDSIAELVARAEREDLGHVAGRVGSLDTVLDDLAGRRFDRIVSSYAFYYAADMVALLVGLADLLTPGGEVFVCGPGKGTNREMADLVRSVAPKPADVPPDLDDFLTADAIDRVRPAYRDVQTHRLNNAVRFADADALLGWWRNHSSHVPSADAAVADAVAEHYRTHEAFRLTKNVLGVHLRS